MAVHSKLPAAIMNQKYANLLLEDLLVPLSNISVSKIYYIYMSVKQVSIFTISRKVEQA